MLKIIAADFANGWAFVRDAEKILLVRPPFNAPTEVAEEAVQKAIAVHQFQSVDDQFNDWRSLIDSITERFIALRRGLGEPSSQEFANLIRRAPKRIILDNLRKLEEKHPSSLLAEELKIVEALLANEYVRDDSSLLLRVTKLSIAIAEALGQSTAVQRDQSPLRFPPLPYQTASGSRAATIVANRRQVFTVGC